MSEVHTSNILFLKEMINDLGSVWTRVITHKHEVWAKSTPEKLNIGFKDLIPVAMCIDSTHIENVKWCNTTNIMPPQTRIPLRRFLVRRRDDSELFALS